MGSGPLYLIGWVLMVSVLGGTVGGFYLDRWLGTTPWLTLVGIFLGMAAGFTSLFRTIQEQERIRRTRDEDQGNDKNGTGI
jgi:ATP synthase protein I